MTIIPAVILVASLAAQSATSAGDGDVLRGRASWVDPVYGARYLAARMHRGTRLRVCGARGCITGRVNDYGPSRRIYPERIVDLSKSRFREVCGWPGMGTCRVRVRILDGA